MTDRPLPPVAPALWPGFTRYLKDRGLNPVLARENGWYPTSLRGPRVVIPATASAGHVYWQARLMEPGNPRYLSPTYARRDALVWCWPPPTDPRSGRVVVVEGPMDALAAADAGHCGVALMGADPPYAAITYLAVLCHQRGIVQASVVPDGDEGGPVLAKVAMALAALGIVAWVLLPSAKDLASMPLYERVQFLR